jgi:hypothetical protein
MSTSSSLPKVKISVTLLLHDVSRKCPTCLTTQLTDVHRRIIAMEKTASAALYQLILPNPEDQVENKQGEMHGHRDTIIYYRVKHPEYIIVCRMETPIEFSLLLCPLLSVSNESELYHTWMP